jgi:16S rRNA (guanine966-N2)-methyltransferase
MDRVKESMFAMVEPLVDTIVVDLFAGTGSLGLEALSRGAAEVHFIELKRRNVKVIEKNLAAVQPALPAEVPVRIFLGDVIRTPYLLPGLQPDLIFTDPPFHPDKDGNGISGADLLRDSEFHKWAGSALVIMEQPVRAPLQVDVREHWDVIRDRKYGDVTLYILKAKGA